MPKVTPEKTSARRQEIINACAKLYETTSFKDITLKDISVETTFTRTSIYNYFQTKEEIFLAILENEYGLWSEELNKIISDNTSLSVKEFSHLLATSLQNRQRLLKLLAMNIYDMESSSRLENLTEFKLTYFNSLNVLTEALVKFFPQIKEKTQNFIFAFLPFMFGIFPYTYATDKQIEAMKRANGEYKLMTVYEIAYPFINNLLKAYV